jgi:hypothetical protein
MTTTEIAALIEATDLDRAVATLGGTRGLSHRGRNVIVVEGTIYVFNVEGTYQFASVPTVTEHSSIEQAERYCRNPRTGDVYIRQMAVDAEERASEDGAGWGR